MNKKHFSKFVFIKLFIVYYILNKHFSYREWMFKGILNSNVYFYMKLSKINWKEKELFFSYYKYKNKMIRTNWDRYI
jgi:hypothetical protein